MQIWRTELLQGNRRLVWYRVFAIEKSSYCSENGDTTVVFKKKKRASGLGAFSCQANSTERKGNTSQNPCLRSHTSSNGVEIRVHGTGMLPLFTMTPTIFSFGINPDDPPLLMKMQDIDGEGYKRELMSVFVPFDTDCRTFLVAHDQNDEIMVSHTCAGLQL